MLMSIFSGAFDSSIQVRNWGNMDISIHKVQWLAIESLPMKIIIFS